MLLIIILKYFRILERARWNWTSFIFLNSNIFLREKKILPLIYFIFDYYCSEKSCFGILFKKEQRRNKGEAIRIRIRFRFRFIETSCLLPLQIKVSAGKLLFRLARNHLPFHYFPCPLHSALFHTSLYLEFFYSMSTTIALPSPSHIRYNGLLTRDRSKSRCNFSFIYEILFRNKYVNILLFLRLSWHF